MGEIDAVGVDRDMEMEREAERSCLCENVKD